MKTPQERSQQQIIQQKDFEIKMLNNLLRDTVKEQHKLLIRATRAERMLANAQKKIKSFSINKSKSIKTK